MFGYTVTRSAICTWIRYFIVGFSTFLLDFFLNWLLIKVIGINYLFVGYIISPFVLLFNFLMHRSWSFRGSQKHLAGPQVVRYVTLVVCNAVINMVLMYLVYDLLDVPLFITRVLLVGVSTLWNFPVMRFWVYK